MLFALPTFVTANMLARNQNAQEFAGFAMLVALALAVPIVYWTIQRLHDANKTGWFALALVPPFTIFLLAYTLAASSTGENTALSFFGIRLKGAWRIIAAVATALFMTYLTALFVTFLTDKGITG